MEGSQPKTAKRFTLNDLVPSHLKNAMSGDRGASSVKVSDKVRARNAEKLQS